MITMSVAFQYLSKDEDDTVRLGKNLAQVAKAGDIFALFGTLGMGKSVLSRAFIRNYMGEVEVPSPTFTLLQTYDAPDFEIYHFDLYRLKHPDEIFEIGMEEAMYNGVCLIEWPEKMGGYLPKKAVKITFSQEKDGRLITFDTANPECAARLQKMSDIK